MADFYEAAIKKFVAWTLTPEGKRYRCGSDLSAFSTSGNTDADMKAIFTGKFEITDLSTNGASEPNELHIQFRVGKTDFYMQGKAAEKLVEFLES